MWRIRGDSPSPEPEVREETPSPVEDNGDVEMQSSPTKPQMADGDCQTEEADLLLTPHNAASFPTQNGFTKEPISPSEGRDSYAATADMGVQSDPQTDKQTSDTDWQSTSHPPSDSNVPPFLSFKPSPQDIQKAQVNTQTGFGASNGSTISPTTSHPLFGTAPVAAQVPRTEARSLGAGFGTTGGSLADEVRFGFSHYPQPTFGQAPPEAVQASLGTFGQESVYPESYLDHEGSSHHASLTPHESYDESTRQPPSQSNLDALPASHGTSGVAPNPEASMWPITAQSLDYPNAAPHMDVNAPLQIGQNQDPTSDDIRSHGDEPETTYAGFIPPHVEDGSRNVDEVREQGILSQPVYEQGVPQAALHHLEDRFEEEDGVMSSDEEQDYDSDQKGDDYDLRNYDRVADDEEGFGEVDGQPPLADNEIMTEMGEDSEGDYDEDSYDEEGEYDDYDNYQQHQAPGPQPSRYAPLPVQRQPAVPVVIDLISDSEDEDEDEAPPPPPRSRGNAAQAEYDSAAKSEPENGRGQSMSGEVADSIQARYQLDGFIKREPEDDRDDDMSEAEQDSDDFHSQPADPEVEDEDMSDDSQSQAHDSEIDAPQDAKLIDQIDEAKQGSSSYDVQPVDDGDNDGGSELQGCEDRSDFEKIDDESEISGEDDEDVAAMVEARAANSSSTRVNEIFEEATVTTISADVHGDGDSEEEVVIEQMHVSVDVTVASEPIEQDDIQSSPQLLQDRDDGASDEDEVIDTEQVHSNFHAVGGSPGKATALPSSPQPREDQDEGSDDEMEVVEEHHDNVMASFSTQPPEITPHDLSQSSDVQQPDDEDVPMSEPQSELQHENAEDEDLSAGEAPPDLPDIIMSQLPQDVEELIEEEMEDAPAADGLPSSPRAANDIPASKTSFEGFSDAAEPAVSSSSPAPQQRKSPIARNDLHVSMTTASSQMETQDTDQLPTPLETQMTELNESQPPFLEEKDESGLVDGEDEEMADGEVVEDEAEIETPSPDEAEAVEVLYEELLDEKDEPAAKSPEADEGVSDSDGKNVVKAPTEEAPHTPGSSPKEPDILADAADDEDAASAEEDAAGNTDEEMVDGEDDAVVDIQELLPREAEDEAEAAEVEDAGSDEADLVEPQEEEKSQDEVDALPKATQPESEAEGEEVLKTIQFPSSPLGEDMEPENQEIEAQKETSTTNKGDDAKPLEEQSFQDAHESPAPQESPSVVPDEQLSFMTASESNDQGAEEVITVKPKRRGRPSKNAKEPLKSAKETRSTRSKPSPLDSSIRFARSAAAFKRGQRKPSDQSLTSPRTTRNMSASFKKSASPEQADASVQLAKAALKTPSKKKAASTAPSASSLKTDLTKRLSSDMPECVPLKDIKKYHSKRLDIAAVATTAPSAPKRTSARQYALSFNVTDPSIVPDQVVEVNMFRAHKDYLPIIKAGDSVLLRGFTVVALKGKEFGLQTHDESSWAVFDSGEDGLPQIRGPPVELDEEETAYLMTMKSWYAALDEAAKGKIEKANQVFDEVNGSK